VQVLKYLARYTHRVAISNQRLVSLSDGEVTFRWKDYANGNAVKEMTLDVRENASQTGFFVRRYFSAPVSTCSYGKVLAYLIEQFC
jgi:hypothetical protein